MTASAIRDQIAPLLRPMGSRSASTRSPRSESSAGTSVSAAATETSTTTIAPTPRLRKIVCGTTNIPIRAITTVRPLKSTAGSRSRRRGRSRRVGRDPSPLLAEAGDDEEGVVHADREAHHHEHVHDEERELPRLPDEGRQPERDDDRDDRDRERHERRDDRAEDEEQHDQGGGEADHLAANEIRPGRLLEVDVDDPLAGRRDFIARLRVEGGDSVDELLDIALEAGPRSSWTSAVRPSSETSERSCRIATSRLRRRDRVVQPARDGLHGGRQIAAH